MAKMLSNSSSAPAKAGAAAAMLVAAIGAQVRAKAEASLRRIRPELDRIAAAREGAAQEEALLGDLTQDQLEKLVSGEKRLGQLAQSLRDRRLAHEAKSSEEGAELKELRNVLKQAQAVGLTAGNPAVKEASARIRELEAAKANRIQGIRDGLDRAVGIVRGLRALPIFGGWKPAEGPVTDLVAAIQAAAKQAAKAKAEEGAASRKGRPFVSGCVEPEGAMAAQLTGVKMPAVAA